MINNLGDAASLATVLGVTFVALGLFYKFVLLPNLREQLFNPVQETHKQVTENGGRNDPPTVPDKLHALQDSVDVLSERVASLTDTVESTAAKASKAVAAATEQAKQIDLAQTVLLEHIKGHTHD